jgi:hypothetical protein
MMKIHLKRRGVADGYEIRNKHFYVEVNSYQGRGYNVEICYPCVYPDRRKAGQRAFCSYEHGLINTLDEVREVIRAGIKNLFGIKVEIESFIEASFYYPDGYKDIWPIIANDIYYNVQAIYEINSNTIMKTPENTCLISWEGGEIKKPVFDINDATMSYLKICESAHNEFLKDHNQRKTDRENKEWLAWLISERIKSEEEEGDPQKRKAI